MLKMILFGIGMLLVTVILQFFLFKRKNNVSFWTGRDPVFIMCVLGLVSQDISYMAGIIGYVVGDKLGYAAGWHNNS